MNYILNREGNDLTVEYKGIVGFYTVHEILEVTLYKDADDNVFYNLEEVIKDAVSCTEESNAISAIMDKVTPELMKENPQQEGETNMCYQGRISYYAESVAEEEYFSNK